MIFYKPLTDLEKIIFNAEFNVGDTAINTFYDEHYEVEIEEVMTDIPYDQHILYFIKSTGRRPEYIAPQWLKKP